MKKAEVHSNFSFQLMTLEYRLRDLRRPPARALRQLGVRPGMSVLDFGCGPGGFSLAAARLVGLEGHVVAVDIHPGAIQRLGRAAGRRGFGQLQVIHRDALEHVPNGSVDVALLFDVLHEVEEPTETLAEIRRLLKQHGILCARDHCMKDAGLLRSITGDGWFQLIDESATPLRFRPAKPSVTKT